MARSQAPGASPFCLFYHEKTKYSPEGLTRRRSALDWSKQPTATKEYRTGELLDLRPYLPGQGLEQADDPRSRLSRVLYLTYGATAVVPYPERPFYMRAAPSAGGLYPAEVYLVSRGDDPRLPPGIYNYQVPSHSLVRFWSGDVWEETREACFGHPAFERASYAVVVSGVFYRSAWRYEDRAYRRVFLDSGHLLGNLELAAALADYRVRLVTGFADDALNALLFLPASEEEVLAVAVLAEGADADPEDGPTALPSPVQFDYPPVPEGQRLAYLHEVSKLVTAPEGSVADCGTEDKYNFPFCLKVPVAGEALDWRGTLDETILHRRSTRQYTGADLRFDELAALLDFTYRPQRYADQGLDPDPQYAHLFLLSTFVVVLGVEGLEAGCYYYAPRVGELRQIRFKHFRREVHHLCLGQELGRDSAAVVIHTADLQTAAERFGERVYRTLHLDSGHLGQRLNLAAIHLGLGVSGIGGFFDDEVNEVLGIPEQEAVLYITTLGRPQPQRGGE
ncbi:SagB/ThcOx family dehydrogenase [Gloeobacter morelensis]|uniref:SagB/ThcOx family dehydrogenase n=1 Tax=Gloeobacter morelensis MG652769 TaxID=2781736 RepID=A0ABY3PGH1_9CYAN|nr:SagB/ThcOx family dehydrogenase [Gloeobacter morelensis]UFP92747.1 SagB/ThcOx family dehydrogenase [Gloeobacter morelensis MG652769]